MSDKNPRVHIDKASWTLVEGIKDAVSTNVLTAAKSNQIGDIKASDLQKLISVINASIDEGFHRGNRVFGRAIDQALTEAALPPIEKAPAKKKPE